MKIYKKMVILAFIFSFLIFFILPVSFSSAPDNSSKSKPSGSEELQGKIVFAHIVSWFPLIKTSIFSQLLFYSCFDMATEHLWSLTPQIHIRTPSTGLVNSDN